MRRSLTLTLLVLFGCQSTPEVKPVSSAPPALLFSMERGACLGRCPVYRLEVFTDGLVRFKGERHVKVTEAVETKLPAAEVEKLARRLEQPGFEKWVDYVQPTTSDLPTVVLTYRGTTIRHARGDERAPAALTQLEDDLDALVGTQQWVAGTGGPTQ